MGILKNKITKYIIICINIILLIWIFFVLNIINFGFSPVVKKADAILVFGTTVNPDGSASRLLRWRLDKAVKYYNEGYSDKIIVSGGKGQEGYEEAYIMRDYLKEKDIPENSIITDKDGSSTILTVQNFGNIAKEADFNSVLVITDYMSLLRTVSALEKARFKEIYYDYSDIPVFIDLTIMHVEIAKLTFYKVQGYI